MSMAYSILTVDDHIVVRLGLSALLAEQEGFDVIGEAASAQEAMKMIRIHQPDVVLMDIHMPGKDGIEACKEIKETWPDIHVIMLTSYTEEKIRSEAMNAGADGYVPKQVSCAELIRTIQHVCQR
ncbi:MAG: response regulator transcription factor [Anaerolineales bacterium]